MLIVIHTSYRAAPKVLKYFFFLRYRDKQMLTLNSFLGCFVLPHGPIHTFTSTYTFIKITIASGFLRLLRSISGAWDCFRSALVFVLNQFGKHAVALHFLFHSTFFQSLNCQIQGAIGSSVKREGIIVHGKSGVRKSPSITGVVQDFWIRVHLPSNESLCLAGINNDITIVQSKQEIHNHRRLLHSLHNYNKVECVDNYCCCP